MPVVAKKFDRYSIHIIAGVPTTTGDVAADIDCYDGGTRVGLMRFFSEPPPSSSQVFNDGTVGLYFPMARFQDIAAVLRHEKPLQLVVNPDTHWGYLGTGELEPVGELEPAIRIGR